MIRKTFGDRLETVMFCLAVLFNQISIRLSVISFVENFIDGQVFLTYLYWENVVSRLSIYGFLNIFYYRLCIILVQLFNVENHYSQ